MFMTVSRDYFTHALYVKVYNKEKRRLLWLLEGEMYGFIYCCHSLIKNN